MTYDIYPYTTLGHCTDVQPLKTNRQTLIGLGGRGKLQAPQHSFQLIISDDAKATAWDNFYETTLVYGTKPFVMKINSLKGAEYKAVRFLQLNKSHSLDDGMWVVQLVLEEIRTELTCTTSSGDTVDGYTAATLDETTLTFTSSEGEAEDPAYCDGLAIDYTAFDFTYEGDLVT